MVGSKVTFESVSEEAVVVEPLPICTDGAIIPREDA